MKQAQRELEEMEIQRDSFNLKARELGESMNNEAIRILLQKKQQMTMEMTVTRQVKIFAP